jgi:hypothetical protein
VDQRIAQGPLDYRPDLPRNPPRKAIAPPGMAAYIRESCVRKRQRRRLGLDIRHAGVAEHVDGDVGGWTRLSILLVAGLRNRHDLD